jgi:hypothetical protein
VGLSDDLAKQRVRGFQKLHGISQPPRYRETGQTTSEHVGVGPVTRKNVAQTAKVARPKKKRRK